MILQPAIALLELDSVAAGIRTGDAMVKRSPLETLRAGTVHPGRYLLLAGGSVAAVEEALAAGLAAAGEALLDRLFLPAVHRDVLAALAGVRRDAAGEALGVLETRTVAAVLAAADAAVKGAEVRLMELRLADGLGGKGYALLAGALTDVEAAVALGVARVAPPLLVAGEVISQLHPEMLENLRAHGEFAPRVRGGDA